MTSSTTRPGRWWNRPRVLVWLVVTLIAIPIAEVWLLITVGERIGPLPTFALLIGTALLGSWLMQREGAKAWRALADAYASGRLPAGELADAALILVGGVLLVLPGFFTDVIGLFFLLPPTRPLARAAVGWLIARRVSRGGVDLGGRQPFGDPDVVIEGETVPDRPSKPDTPPDGDSGVIKGALEP